MENEEIQEEPKIEEDFKLEVVDEVPEKDEKTLELEAKVAEMEAREQALREKLEQKDSADPAVILAQELKKLAGLKEEQAGEKRPEETPVDFKAIMDNVDKNFYSSPSKAIIDMVTPIVESVDKKYSSVYAQQAANIAKLKVLADDSLKNDYVKYKDEVEAIVKTSPPSETVYEEAVKKVKANHLDDIIAEQVAAKIAEITAQAEANVQVQQAPQFTNATQVQQAAKANVVKITPAQQIRAKTWALTKGYDWNDPGDREWVVKYLKGQGAL